MISELNICSEGRRVFDIEIEALRKTKDCIGGDFELLVRLILNCSGKVVITGMGKQGHIAKKIAASLSSLGTPSTFMHPGEALHGDLGMVDKNDVVIIASYSGESEEVLRLIPTLKEIGCITIAITGRGNSSLARHCNYQFIFPSFEEACYMGLAPTSSTTALLTLGDALAVVCAKERNYSREDFGLRHPAGALGKKLLVKVGDIMHSGEENATVKCGVSLQAAIIEMCAKGLNMVSVIDQNGHLCGILTDGDLRRMLKVGVNVYKDFVDDYMNKTPIKIDSREMAVNALEVMNAHNITCMPVVDVNEIVVGTIRVQDIIKSGIA